MALPLASVVFRYLPQFLRRHRLITLWLQLTGEDPLQLVPVLGGVQGYADLREGFLRLIIIEGEFETDFFELARRVFPPSGTFFDVGANYGLMTVGMAGVLAPGAHYHLFEPNPGITPVIARSLARLGTPDSQINCAAVSDADGPLRMLFDQAHSGASHVSDEGVSVPVLRLDDYIRQHATAGVDFMKIDVEGYEASVLKSMPHALCSGAVRVIYFEYMGKWLDRYGGRQEVPRILVDAGFRIFYCRRHDLKAENRPLKSLRVAGARSEIVVAEVSLKQLPEATDLLAVHQTAIESCCDVR